MSWHVPVLPRTISHTPERPLGVKLTPQTLAFGCPLVFLRGCQESYPLGSPGTRELGRWMSEQLGSSPTSWSYHHNCSRLWELAQLGRLFLRGNKSARCPSPGLLPTASLGSFDSSPMPARSKPPPQPGLLHPAPPGPEESGGRVRRRALRGRCPVGLPQPIERRGSGHHRGLRLPSLRLPKGQGKNGQTALTVARLSRDAVVCALFPLAGVACCALLQSATPSAG